MRYPVTVEFVRPGELDKQAWRFSMHDFPNITLDRYCEYSRKTKRHKWEPEVVWNRLCGRRDNNIERPDPPEWVLEQFKKQIIESMRFV